MSKKKGSKIVNYVTLGNGGKLHLSPISQAELQGIGVSVRREMLEAGEPLDPPVYVTKAEETIEWDKESIEKDGTSEDKVAWAAYELAMQTFNRENEQRVIYYVLTESPTRYVSPKGTEIDLMIDDLDPEWEPPEPWVKRHTKTGYQVPDDPWDRKFDFVSTLVKGMGPVYDIIAKANALGLAGAITDEGVAQAEATFRDTMESATGKAEEKILSAIKEAGRLATEGT